MWKVFRLLGNHDTKRKASPRISEEAVGNALIEIRGEETHTRSSAQYRLSETSYISSDDHFAAVQIDRSSKGGNGRRLTRSSLTSRISSRTIFPPVQSYTFTRRTRSFYHIRFSHVNIPIFWSYPPFHYPHRANSDTAERFYYGTRGTRKSVGENSLRIVYGQPVHNSNGEWKTEN